MIRLRTPLTQEKLKDLKMGDEVSITGTIYTARDAAHERLVKLLEEGKELPIEMKDQIIYYVGPSPAKPGEVIGAAGPTTSYRMDPYTPQLLVEPIIVAKSWWVNFKLIFVPLFTLIPCCIANLLNRKYSLFFAL